MLQYDLARFQMRDREAAAARARVRGELRKPRVRRPLRAVVGRRLVLIGIRLTPAQA